MDKHNNIIDCMMLIDMYDDTYKCKIQIEKDFLRQYLLEKSNNISNCIDIKKTISHVKRTYRRRFGE